MAKCGSRFFDGYEAEVQLDRKGRERRVLVYRGAWYGLGLEKDAYRSGKLVCAGLTALMTAAYLLINFFPAEGGMTPWVGAPCLLALVSLIFLWIGVVNFLLAREKWELRVLYAGYQRVRFWTVVFLVLMALTGLAEGVYLLTHGATAGELFYLLGVLLCIGSAIGLLEWQRRHPAVVVQGPDIR